MSILKKIPHLKTLLALLLFLGLSLPLQAEMREYRSRLQMGQMVQKVISGMARYKIKISVRKVYNAGKDGREGFVFWMFPGKTHGEIRFYQNDKKGYSMVRLWSSNKRDALRFNKMLTEYVRMKEVGKAKDEIKRKPRRSGNWLPRL